MDAGGSMTSTLASSRSSIQSGESMNTSAGGSKHFSSGGGENIEGSLFMVV